jgi:Uma2 family endonuclease
MATEIISSEIPQVLPPDVRPCVDHLVTEDDTPVDNVFSEKQQRLLTEPLYSSWTRAAEGREFVALANVGLFFAVRQPPFVPDMLLSLDVALPADLHPKPHRSYFVWEYGKPPDVVVEVVSNTEGGEDSVKLSGYARIGVRYYVIHDPEQLLSDQPLRAFQLEAMTYRPMDEPLWLTGVELGLNLWHGRYEDHENTWLRWVDANGTPIPTGAERADQERQRAEHECLRAEHQHQRAEHERLRAEQERQRADRLADQLRRLGAEPEA